MVNPSLRRVHRVNLSKLPPNPSVNRYAPVRVFSLASDCAGAPVTLAR
jgi:hypothetical protein